MGVSTGQIFQPKIMSVVEPQQRESVWAQVLPTILTSLAQTAVKGYVENTVNQNKIEQEKLAKGYTKNPDGTWNPPKFEVKEVVPGMYSYSYAGQAGLHNAPKTSATTVEELLGLDTIEKIKANPENKSQIIADALKAKHPTSTEQIIQDQVWEDGTVGPGVMRNGKLERIEVRRPGQAATPTGGSWGLQPQSGAAPTQAKQTISANAFSPTTRATPTAAQSTETPIAPTQPLTPTTGAPTTPSTTAQVVGQVAPQYAVSAPKKETGADASRKYQDIEMRRELGRPLTPEDEAFSKAYEKEKTLASEARITAYTKLGENFTNWDNDTKYTAFERKLYGENPDFGTGVGAVNNKSTFEKEYNQWLQRVGLSGKESLATRADFKADTSSLLQATKTLDSISSFGRGAKESFGLITDLANDYKNGKFPGVNKWNQVFDYYIGDPKVKALQNAVQTSMLEYMKVTTAGSGVTAAELSVRAQETAANLLKSHDNPETMKKAIETFKKEIDIVEDARKEQKKQILTRMKSAESADGPTTQPPPPATTPDASPAPSSAATKPMSIYDFYQRWTTKDPQRAATKEGQNAIWQKWLEYQDMVKTR